jgi:hypothetical protein
MAQHAAGQQSGSSKGSWLDRAVDTFKRQPGPPPKPAAPPVHEDEWQKSVERKEVVPGLTVRDVGLSIFGETKSLHDRPGSNESLGSARQKVAHMIINGAEKWGLDRVKFASTALPIEPSDKEKRDPATRAAYESAMNAAREAYLSGHDPTNGALHFNIRSTPNRSDWKGQFPISTQSGPYSNSFVKGDVKSHTTWINTYFPDENEKRARKR